MIETHVCPNILLLALQAVETAIVVTSLDSTVVLGWSP